MSDSTPAANIVSAVSSTVVSSRTVPDKDEPTPGGYDRSELVRLIVQSLRSLGYDGAASAVETESGIQFQSEHVNQFSQHVLCGQWPDALALLPTLQLDTLDLRCVQFLIMSQKYLELLEARKLREALQCLRVELTPLTSTHKNDAMISSPSASSSSSSGKARVVTPLDEISQGGDGDDDDPDDLVSDLHRLASYMMCADAASLKQKAKWDGATGASRKSLLDQIRVYVDPSAMIADNRLETLLDQAIIAQTEHCAYPAAGHRSMPPSLLEDHVCEGDHIPRVATHVLEKHAEEVWVVRFSHSGRYLASGSKDTTIIIWTVPHPLDAPSSAHTNSNNNSSNNIGINCYSSRTSSSSSSSSSSDYKPFKTLVGHTGAVCNVAWSPDDRHLLSCAASTTDMTVRLWSVEHGACLKTFAKHNDFVPSCVWMSNMGTPSGRAGMSLSSSLATPGSFFSGGNDRQILCLTTDERVLKVIDTSRVNDLALSPNKKVLIVAGDDQTITMYDVDTGSVMHVMTETHPITSIHLSNDGRFLIACLQATPTSTTPPNNGASSSESVPEIHLWDIERRVLVQRYTGMKQQRFVVRACFGGPGQTWVVSGSEDNKIYVWHRDQGTLLEVLSAHLGTVNDVSWSPANPNMFASASDDHSIRIWNTDLPIVHHTGRRNRGHYPTTTGPQPMSL
eukprot:TRINITY_DN5772_c0_g1_i1.p1 TRINITY_DN5772_c0_g1~~TRINITY_DN5772_c0_g1_i1.p1  ORF type:complete len:776 (-),score=189.68 TRINITY_DN5772_c0_g1_i1:1205-3241(-)